ncbi:MAG: hypothetical protein P9M06_07555 [Candidatus Saelkia tenebricola]|nr:hypothetical protein [Candidatus Saelkia tenebricola]
MLSEIEKAIYYNNLPKDFPRCLDETRIYFGNEFCEHLIPGINETSQMIKLCKERNIKLSYLTPYVTDLGIKRLLVVFEFLNSLGFKGEVIVNDFGVLELIRNKKYDFKLVLGRLLNRQKRGPRLANILNKLPADLIEHFSSTYLDREEVILLLSELGIERIELDNLPLGIGRPSMSKIKASIYYPFVYISTTRLCPTNKAFRQNFRLRLIEDCKAECRICNFKLRHKSIPGDLILKGNTYFLYWDKLPSNLGELGIDRIVFQPEIPI